MFKCSFKLFLLLCFLSIGSTVQGAEIKKIGVPYVRNYSKNTYQFGNQNWSEAKDENGIMYFGNSDGLLSFDGHYWQHYRLPNRMIVRAVATDGKGKIYTGAFGEIGYWTYNPKRELSYKSLTHLIPAKYPLNEEVWKIYIDNQQIIFQTFGSIYIYSKGKIHVIKAPRPYLFLFKVANRYFVEQIGVGLFELVNGKLQFLNGSDIVKTGVLAILPFGDGGYLIATAKSGLYLFDGTKVKPWKNQADTFLRKYQLNNGVKIPGNYYAFGTILNGVVIIDSSGNIVQHINKLSGLQNNTVLSLYLDDQENLWAGLDNGIDCIEINSPLYFYPDKGGELGTVYTSMVKQDKIYLGTNQGLFYSNWPGTNSTSFSQAFDFKLIPGSQGQVWDLSLIDGDLLCGHNEGTYRVRGGAIEKIANLNGGWTIKKLNTTQLIQGTYTGLAIYQKSSANKWVFSHKIAGFSQPSRYVEPGSSRQIWVSHAYKGVYKINLDTTFTKAATVRYYDERSGLPSSYNVGVFNLNGKIVFTTPKGFYSYDEISDRFFPYDQLNKSLGAFSHSNKIIPAGEKKYWFFEHGRVAMADLAVDGKVSMSANWLNLLTGKMVQYYENISKINQDVFLISVDDGFVVYNAKSAAIKPKYKLPKVLVRKLEILSDKSAELEADTEGELSIPYAANTIRLSYALPYYAQSKIKFQYLLEGYADEWSDWTPQFQQEFTNLPHGDYTFKIKALVDDNRETSITELNFTILPPWYLSKWAWLFYILIAGMIYKMGRTYFKRKLIEHQSALQKKLLREREEALRQEQITNEQLIIKLKNEQLQADLESKNRELANSAMNIVYKNELLQKISTEIGELKDRNGNKLSSDQLKPILKVIEEGMTDERDWTVFEHSFNDAHENFFKKLKADHPDLVPNDLKLCAYLRMNMSSKEIASLLNISLRGVEIRRYRLRKKFKLAHDKNLSEFLLEL